MNFKDHNALKDAHKKWTDGALEKPKSIREDHWTQSIAVGDKTFIEKIKEYLGDRARGRRVIKNEAAYQLKESQTTYGVSLAV